MLNRCTKTVLRVTWRPAGWLIGQWACRLQDQQLWWWSLQITLRLISWECNHIHSTAMDKLLPSRSSFNRSSQLSCRLQWVASKMHIRVTQSQSWQVTDTQSQTRVLLRLKTLFSQWMIWPWVRQTELLWNSQVKVEWNKLTSPYSTIRAHWVNYFKARSWQTMKCSRTQPSQRNTSKKWRKCFKWWTSSKLSCSE